MARDDQELFLLRIWAEPRELPGRPSIYRGWVEHVRSARSIYFAELDEVTPFIRSCLAEDAALPDGGFASELEG